MKLHLILITALSLLMFPLTGQRNFSGSDITKLILLGTGNPNPSPTQSGCSLALLVNKTPYIIDFGPGLIRKAAALTSRYGGPLEEFHIKDIKTAFLTHLHSDHTTGYPDLILTPWVMGRDEPLRVFGPEGTASMTSHILEAYRDDIHYRVYGAEPANDKGWRVDCQEFSKEGVIYRDSNIIVEAFPVTHGSWPNSWGFRFTTPDRVIVVSGDCRPSEKVVEYATGADILVHEVYSQAGYETRSDSWKAYHADHHTSTIELAGIASRTMPGKVVLYHILFWDSSEEELIREIRSIYQGPVEVGHDLDIY
jgi:ribonuclease Z